LNFPIFRDYTNYNYSVYVNSNNDQKKIRTVN